MKSTKRHYGWKRQLPDQRDLQYRPLKPAVSKFLDIPEAVDLRSLCPPIYDQGELGSCTANAIVGAYEFDQIKQDELISNRQPLSRLFLYYNERNMEGTVDSDAGANIRDGIKSIGIDGLCPEVLWPYDISKFAETPVDLCYKQASLNKAILYSAVAPTIQDIQTVLADGYPVVFGFTVYESFESADIAKSGIMPMPKRSERVVGGHAVVAVGYYESPQQLLVRNSWGAEWGMNGYFLMPFGYLHLASDFWVVKSVE